MTRVGPQRHKKKEYNVYFQFFVLLKTVTVILYIIYKIKHKCACNVRHLYTQYGFFIPITLIYST